MTSLFSYTESVLVLIAAAGFCMRKSRFATALCIIYFGWLICFGITSVSGSMMSGHVLAPAHILLSLAAKTGVIALIVDSFRNRGNYEKSWLAAALLAQSASIILGMFWAFDDPAWGALWQWDNIETVSLCIWIALFGWYRYPLQQQKWAVCLLILLVIQNSIIHGLLVGADSIHSYGYRETEWGMLAGLLVWAVCVCLPAFYPRCRCLTVRYLTSDINPGGHQSGAECTAIRAETVQLVCIACGVFACFGGEISGLVWSVVFLFMWAMLYAEWNRVSLVIFGAGLVTMVWLWAMPGDSQTMWAQLNSENGWELMGIQAEQDEDGLHYSATVRKNRSERDVVFVAGKQGVIPSGYVEFLDFPHLYRVWGIDYRANKGVALLIRDTEMDRALELWMFLLFMSGLFRGIRPIYQALKDPKQNEDSGEH